VLGNGDGEEAIKLLAAAVNKVPLLRGYVFERTVAESLWAQLRPKFVTNEIDCKVTKPCHNAISSRKVLGNTL
jgi:hypothetical protein